MNYSPTTLRQTHVVWACGRVAAVFRNNPYDDQRYSRPNCHLRSAQGTDLLRIIAIRTDMQDHTQMAKSPNTKKRCSLLISLTEYSNSRNDIRGQLYFENKTTYSQVMDQFQPLVLGKLFDLRATSTNAESCDTSKTGV